MIIYFEDGLLNRLYSDEEFLRVNASQGYTANYNQLITIEKYRKFNTKVYTNSLVALSNRWCWDEVNKIPQLYIRNKDGDWENITCFTDREIRESHNLAHMYVNGEFDIFR